MFQRLGFGEILLILVIALVIFGPSKLPQLGKSIGSSIREFKSAIKDGGSEPSENGPKQ